jgi:hypothetical protein
MVEIDDGIGRELSGVLVGTVRFVFSVGYGGAMSDRPGGPFFTCGDCCGAGAGSIAFSLFSLSFSIFCS